MLQAMPSGSLQFSQPCHACGQACVQGSLVTHFVKLVPITFCKVTLLATWSLSLLFEVVGTQGWLLINVACLGLVGLLFEAYV